MMKCTLPRSHLKVQTDHRCNSVYLLQGTSVCQVTVVGAIVILLYSSRACYNLVVLGLSNKRINSFDYDWYNVSDQVRRNASLEFSEMCLEYCVHQLVFTESFYLVLFRPIYR